MDQNAKIILVNACLWIIGMPCIKTSCQIVQQKIYGVSQCNLKYKKIECMLCVVSIYEGDGSRCVGLVSCCGQDSFGAQLPQHPNK